MKIELGMDNVTPGNDTYVHCPDSEAQLVARIAQDLSKFRIVPDDSEEKLALLYQTPKFHKNPPKMVTLLVISKLLHLD